MFLWISAFLLGFILAFRLPILPSFITLSVLLVIAVLTIPFVLNCKKYSVVAFVHGLLTGLVFVLIYCSLYFQQQFIADGKKLYQLQAKLVAVTAAERSTKLTLMPVSIAGQAVNQNWWLPRFYVRVSVYQGKPNTHLDLQVGDKIELTAKLVASAGYANRAGFNYQQWLLYKRILATGYSKINDIDVIERQVSARARVIMELQQAISELASAPYIMAIALGDKSLIDSDNYDLLNQMGISHLLAISGLHIGIVYGGIWLFCRQLTRLFRMLLSPHFLVVTSLSVLWCYIYLIDFSISATRAGLLITCWMVIRLGFLFLNRFHLLLLVAVFSLIIEPFAPLSASWWLSFSAASSIIFYLYLFPQYSEVRAEGNSLCLVWKQKIQHFFWQLCKLQLCLFCFILPVSIYWFSGVSVSGLWVNLIAIPLFSFVLIPLIFIAAVSYLTGLYRGLELFNFIDVLLSGFLQLLSSKPVFSYWLDLPQASSHLIVVVILVLLLMPYGWRQVGGVCSAFFALTYSYLVFGQKVIKPEVRFSFLDVGQGTAVVVQQGNEALLYDLGPVYPSGFNLTESVILPSLNNRGITNINSLIISHQDSDHRGDITALDNYQINRKILGCEQAVNITETNWIWRSLKIEMLWPIAEITDFAKLNKNDLSCVFMFTHLESGKRVLLPGDIGSKVEQQLVGYMQQGKLNLNADVLLSSHHGSKYSSSTEFLKTVNPQLVIHSAGVNNRFGFPTDEVVKRIQALSIRQLATNQVGEIQLAFDTFNTEGNIKTSTQLNALTPFWQRNDPFNWQTPIR